MILLIIILLIVVGFIFGWNAIFTSLNGGGGSRLPLVLSTICFGSAAGLTITALLGYIGIYNFIIASALGVVLAFIMLFIMIKKGNVNR